jgi:branched-chain amino acid transport system substrate-binding protein
MGGDGWDSSDLDLKAADGGFYTNHYSPTDPRPEVQNFLKAYGAKYKGAVPDALAALAYDATNMLLQAIKEAGSVDTDKVRVALEKITFNGVSGKITFDKLHNPVKSAPILAVKGGKIVVETVVNP